MIPIAFISALTTLANLEKLLPFLKPVVSMVTIKTALEAYLPQLALIIFLAILPNFLLFLSKAEGIPSVSHAGRAASGKYFYFTVFNVFIGVTIGGTLFESLKSIEKDPNSAFTLLATSLPANATFFLTYVALKFFVGYGLELSQIVPFIIYHLERKYLCKTEAERKEAWAPGDLGLATGYLVICWLSQLSFATLSSLLSSFLLVRYTLPLVGLSFEIRQVHQLFRTSRALLNIIDKMAFEFLPMLFLC
ncbi:CSC1-like protein ERD4 [Camellia lanceoleosa]|uniref:CSC1-like protein ERD4 n=1 Tax=Camellia lanceoleosa TaxID=1840588 RepID=A0ACC0GL28_9ERIC|nr:CSC1-like protein ERD4 [Camellia lanceoleosa]